MKQEESKMLCNEKLQLAKQCSEKVLLSQRERSKKIAVNENRLPAAADHIERKTSGKVAAASRRAVKGPQLQLPRRT